MTRAINPTFKDIEKLFLLIDKYNFSIQQFQNFKYGRALDKLTNDEILLICDKISKYGNKGKWTALTILYMYCYNSEEKWSLNMSYFKSLIIGSNMTINNDNTTNYDCSKWSYAIIKILTKEKDDKFAITITKQIIEFCLQTIFDHSFDPYIGNILKLLSEKYFVSTWNYLGEGIIGEYITFFHLEHLIGARNGYLGREGIIFENPEHNKIILEWCRKHSTIAPERIAHMMPLSNPESTETKWHPFSKTIIDEFGDNENVLSQLSSNMGTYGLVGSSVSYFITQKKLLTELINHDIPRVKKWAKEKLEFTNKTIKIEKLNDEEHYLN